MGPKDLKHGRLLNESDQGDPLEKLLKDTGCLELHYQVQACIFETQDWRKCQTVVQEFRKCMEDHKKKSDDLTV